ncbi:unnamed protein product [Penicillium salamii]|uniref:Ankyrin repeat protein n=1 Tax=Penicillium salamii TaxID=1612424 RepID=A0A9W4NTD9_9EURO|nr:unnamed protein product [Penicillium salamii]CAG8331246.1 unnamed protein product [Penicillium salamii]CAG8413392.1 unnamed protein product [Penicillium salamii]CAG8414448.1 unnamed protein product [Penicillium salamii]CAG8417834.1 unnamed protein product [Penicillium salamii]
MVKYQLLMRKKRNSEASLFKAFTKSLKEGDTGSEVNPNDTTEATQQGQVDQHGNDQNAHSDEGSQNKTPDRRSTDNLYADISEETKLLREVKDICDELNMLKNLAEDQDDVWTQVWKGGNRPDATTYDTPTEVKAEIEEMVNEAEFVQKAIETLLDLKQKRANIVEAEFTRQQSHDTAVQSDTIMVFTVVTILFLPASFLTSLLALNISDFPHAGGDVKFEGRLIFPVIFGVSVAVSGLFSIIAFNASKLKEFLGWKKHHTNVASITSQPNSRSGSSSSLPVNESQVNKSSISVKEMSSSRENLQDHSYPEQPGVPWYKGRRRKLQEGVGV